MCRARETHQKTTPTRIPAILELLFCLGHFLLSSFPFYFSSSSSSPAGFTSPNIYVDDAVSIAKYFPTHYLTPSSKQLCGVGMTTPIVRTGHWGSGVMWPVQGVGESSRSTSRPSSAANFWDHLGGVTSLPGPQCPPMMQHKRLHTAVSNPTQISIPGTVICLGTCWPGDNRVQKPALLTTLSVTLPFHPQEKEQGWRD